MTTSEAAGELAFARESCKLSQREMASRLGLSRRHLQRLEAGTHPILPGHLRRLASVIEADGWRLPRSLGPLEEALLQILDVWTDAATWRERFKLFQPRRLTVNANTPGWTASVDEGEGSITFRPAGRNRISGPHPTGVAGSSWFVTGGREPLVIRGPAGETFEISNFEGKADLRLPAGWRIELGATPPPDGRQILLRRGEEPDPNDIQRLLDASQMELVVEHLPDGTTRQARRYRF